MAMQKKHPELELAFAIPNGGQRNKATAGKLKAEGVKPGVPDIFLPVPRDVYNGLFIEMKPTPNKTLKVPVRKPTEAQTAYIKALNKQGYMAIVCYGWEVAKKVIEKYMEEK